eukprot:CAMPEP_0197523232 /NCGR_PEP_ID=MMETSP1318-20131121/8207_1 /TAXON_ID=552666 /ORGANISM="Partenskyella glossopodia, Strain RCC365" /LENGTH=74 /DNA_ID=CAMNT_0043075857 /DNA_START=65 /DNA_END=289 /DNA_ORIENTATION=+
MLDALVKGMNIKPNKIPDDVKTVGNRSIDGGPKTYLRTSKAIRSHRIAGISALAVTGMAAFVLIPRMAWGTHKE